MSAAVKKKGKTAAQARARPGQAGPPSYGLAWDSGKPKPPKAGRSPGFQAEPRPEHHCVLSPAVVSFLSEATNIPLIHIDTCWDVLKDDAWLYPTAAEVNQEDEKAFIDYGWARGLSEYYCN